MSTALIVGLIAFALLVLGVALWYFWPKKDESVTKEQDKAPGSPGASAPPSETPGPSAPPSGTPGPSAPPAGPYTKLTGVDYPSGSLIRYSDVPFSNCIPECDAIADCAGYVINKDNGRGCWLKSDFGINFTARVDRDTFYNSRRPAPSITSPPAPITPAQQLGGTVDNPNIIHEAVEMNIALQKLLIDTILVDGNANYTYSVLDGSDNRVLKTGTITFQPINNGLSFFMFTIPDGFNPATQTRNLEVKMTRNGSVVFTRTFINIPIIIT